MNTGRYNVAIPQPDYHSRAGSLLLRSNAHNYGRCVLTSNWHMDREGYPKDYDFSVAPDRNMKRASYKNIGFQNDGSKTGETCYNTFYTSGVFKPPNKHGAYVPMVDTKTFTCLDLDRELNRPKRGYGSFLPRYNEDQFDMHLLTSYMAHYKAPYPYTPKPEVTVDDAPDMSAVYKRCRSQFGEADSLRPGRNTWHDESGLYANTHLRRQIFNTTDTIPVRPNTDYPDTFQIKQCTQT